MNDLPNATNSLPAIPAAKGLLVFDFDGTITGFDFYDLVSRAFPEIARNHWQRYEAGEISHFEAMRLIFASIRAPEARILESARAMRIEPRLAEAAVLLETHGWNVIVVSAGCAWYVQRLLSDAREALADIAPTTIANLEAFTTGQPFVEGSTLA